MASQKRLPKPNGESECSRRTATVPVTCFIDVKRNATTKRVTRELVAVVFGCGALMLAPPCKPDGKSRCATLSIASPSTIIPSPAGRPLRNIGGSSSMAGCLAGVRLFGSNLAFPGCFSGVRRRLTAFRNGASRARPRPGPTSAAPRGCRACCRRGSGSTPCS